MTRSQGFTLIELMIVVAIVGILAAIAIPSFRAYVYRSKTSQGVATLGEIRQRQEAYRAEFGQYCNVNSQYPTAALALGNADRNAIAFDTPAPDNWRMLGFTGRGYTYFRFHTAAAAPGADPPGYAGLGLNGINDFTFGAQARANLDGDGAAFFLEILSPREAVYANVSGGYE
ncbi:MAG: prepilin-type N-terminal cleavage/methylation domain-containing protein [Deltaproteobacteria bacterium]|nr:prepilin-type N-terminal cleavage/methylation domain-containing protein [Deltaproteobacteria bacterium]